MKLLSVALAVLICLFPGNVALAQEEVVSVSAIPPGEPLSAGITSEFSIELSITEPYHINSDQPLEDYLIPTTLELEAHPDVEFGQITFPPAVIKNLPVSDSPMALFERNIRISVKITPSPDLEPRNIVVRGKVRYQACDDRTCLPPVSAPFDLALSVEKSELSTKALQVDDTSSGLTAAATDDVDRPTGRALPVSEPIVPANAAATGTDFDEKGIFLTFLLVFLGGLALNLTPCVYPMIPITITYFGGQAQGKKGSILLHSTLYVAGMAVTYSILGVVAAMTGGLFGAAYQYPLVLIAFALIMVALALSMFDVYELRLPASVNRFAAGSHKGFGGTLLMGLTVGIIAAPCIGPFVLGLLSYVGNKGSVFLGFALFFVLAIGLGIPFIFLGVFSGSIHRLPRSGAWMVWVRKIFGFVLLAMAIFFLKNLLPSLLTYHLATALILLLAGIYLAWIDPVSTAGKLFPYVRNMVGILFFGAALYFAVTGFHSAFENASIVSMGPRAESSIQWQPYSDELLDRASEEGKPVFIDFFADWCAPCKELDTHTFSAPEVIERSREFVMFKVDLTSSDDPQSESLRKKYRALGVPTLVFLDSSGKELDDLRIIGFEPKEVMLAKMNRALQLNAERLKGSG